MKNKQKKIILIGAVSIAAIIVAILCFAVGTKNKEADDLAKIEEIELIDGLFITHKGAYSGEFWEDGTDEEVSDIYSIVIENRGTQVLQYAEITIELEGKQAKFSLSTLPIGEKVQVLEQNKLEYQDSSIQNATIENVVFFRDGISMYEDIFEISGLDGALNVKNISDKDITGDIFIYYKNYGAEMFYGGITYRARIEGGISAGEIKQVMTSHYSLEDSLLMMITYTE